MTVGRMPDDANSVVILVTAWAEEPGTTRGRVVYQVGDEQRVELMCGSSDALCEVVEHLLASIGRPPDAP
jgi:hypothetical protein